MPEASRSLFTGLVVAAVVTLVAGVISAFAVGSGSSHVSTAGSVTPPTVTELPGLPGVNPTPGVGETSTTGTGASSTVPGQPTTTATTPPTLPPAAGPVGDPGQPTAEAQGTYSYNYTESGSGNGGKATTGAVAEKVTTVSVVHGVTRQTVVDTGPGIAASQNRIVEWRPAGYYEIQRAFNFNGQSVACTWNPAVQEAPTGLAIGKAWTLSGACELAVYGQQVKVSLSGSAMVTGKERVSVGGEGVNVWVVSDNYTATATNPLIGSFVIHFTATDRFAARLGLLVEEDSNETVTSRGAVQTATVHEALKSLHAAA